MHIEPDTLLLTSCEKRVCRTDPSKMTKDMNACIAHTVEFLQTAILGNSISETASKSAARTTGVNTEVWTQVPQRAHTPRICNPVKGPKLEQN